MSTVQTATEAVCKHNVGNCAREQDKSLVLAELSRSASLRRLDLMARTGLSRIRVANALDELRAAGIVQSFSMGSRYSLRIKESVAQ